MALYRRYRPQRFQDVIGQEQVTKPLMAALRADKTAHAYLFSGPRGCGKTTSARILARCLNCAEAPTDSPCGECESCRELSLEGSGSLDVVEMDAASHGGVDDARDLIERASFAPARDRYKIFIIDEAHMVSNQGFNALLKLVEEPPPHIKFIFATTEPEKVIGTIRSRTHHYPFRLVPPDVLERFLAQICDEEGIDVGAGVLPLVVRSGGGSVRDSLSVLDQLIGGSEGSTLNYQDAVGLLGYTDGSLLDDVVDALAANDGATVFSVVDRVVQSGHDPRRFVEDLLQRLRDLIVIALAGESATDVLASVPRDQYERMVAQSNHLGAARASRCADLVNEALSAMVGATSPRLQLELLCARLLLPEPAAEAAGVQGEQAPVEHPARPAAAQRPQGQRPASAQRSEQPAGNRAPANPTPRGRQIDPAWAAAPDASHAGEAQADQGGAESRGTARAATPAQNAEQRTAGQRTAEQRTAGQEPREQQAPSRQQSSREQQVPSDQQSAAPGQDATREQGASPARKDAAPAGADASIIRQRWAEVVTAVQSQSRSTAALIQTNAQVGSFASGELVLMFQTAGLATTFNNRGHAPRVEAALHDVLGIQASVQGEVGDGNVPKAPAPRDGGAAPTPPQSRTAQAPHNQEPRNQAPQSRAPESRAPEPQPPRAARADAGLGAQPETSPQRSQPEQQPADLESGLPPAPMQEPEEEDWHSDAFSSHVEPAQADRPSAPNQSISQPARSSSDRSPSQGQVPRQSVSPNGPVLSTNRPAASTNRPAASASGDDQNSEARGGAPADVAGVLAQLVDNSVDEILAKSTVPEGHDSSRLPVHGSDGGQDAGPAAAFGPGQSAGSAPSAGSAVSQGSDVSQGPGGPAASAGEPITESLDGSESGTTNGQAPETTPSQSSTAWTPSTGEASGTNEGAPSRLPTEPPYTSEEAPEEPFYAQQMPTPPRPQDLGAPTAPRPSSSAGTGSETRGEARQASASDEERGTQGSGEFRVTPPMRPVRMASVPAVAGADAPSPNNGNSIASRIRKAHGGGSHGAGSTTGGFGGYGGYPDRSPFSASADEGDEVSADDPTIAQSNLVGIDVVLDTFKGTVIEEIVGEKEY